MQVLTLALKADIAEAALVPRCATSFQVSFLQVPILQHGSFSYVRNHCFSTDSRTKSASPSAWSKYGPGPVFIKRPLSECVCKLHTYRTRCHANSARLAIRRSDLDCK